MLWQNADLKCIPRPVLACEAHRQCVNYLQCSSADIRGGWCQQGCLLSHALLVELAAQLLDEVELLSVLAASRAGCSAARRGQNSVGAACLLLLARYKTLAPDGKHAKIIQTPIHLANSCKSHS